MAAITVLGIAQDGGRPQPGCQRPCCQDLSAADYRSPVSLGIKTENGTTKYIEMVRTVTNAGSEDNSENKIIKTIAREVLIDKI